MGVFNFLKPESQKKVAEPVSKETLQAYFSRGNDYYSEGKYDQAITEYNKIIDLDPSLPTIYNNRGYAYKLQGNNKQAISDLDYPDVDVALFI